MLAQEKVIIYEAAFVFKNLFIRTDILIKDHDRVELIEVKAKSFDGEDHNDFLTRKGNISSGWRPYLYDVAFQKYVLSNAKPEYQINAYLMLADKNKKASVDGLNQCFPVICEGDRKKVRVRDGLTREDLGTEILIRINVDNIIENIFNGSDFIEKEDMSFVQWIDYLSKSLLKNERIRSGIGKKCRDCEFKCTVDDNEKGMKSGFEECWMNQVGLSREDFQRPLILDIWDYREKDRLIAEGKYFMGDVDQHEIVKKSEMSESLSKDERRWLQIQKAINQDDTPFLDIKGLNEVMKYWKYPLHFIDFETTALAIPVNKGLQPYEGVAFQFSHHQVEKDASIMHKGQYLNTDRGKFPSFDFIRALKTELEHDEGTIFRYHNHENTYLNIIYKQLARSTKAEVPDKDELIGFIKQISHSGGQTSDNWTGERDMIDLYQLVIKYYYNRLMGGSNSIKVVLPSVINTSKYIQDKYSQPIYGNPSGIPSLNFDRTTWIRYDQYGNIVNPYDLLPPLEQHYNDEQLSSLFTGLEIKEGGAAMMAYARMQFTEMPENEARAIQQALLRYCELDTFAMVLIWEYWASELEKA